MSKRLAATILGILLWLAVLPALFPLPTTEVTQIIQIYKESLAESSEILTPSKTEPEWKTQMREYISNPKDQENILWVKWAASLSLITIAIFAWVLFYVHNPISKWFILITSLIFILINTVLSPKTYSGFSTMFLSGSLHLLPCKMIASTIFYHAVMPLLLCVLATMAF